MDWQASYRSICLHLALGRFGLPYQASVWVLVIELRPACLLYKCPYPLSHLPHPKVHLKEAPGHLDTAGGKVSWAATVETGVEMSKELNTGLCFSYSL